jgi:glycosyltransferase involved in cell wall biosynthesis
MRVIRLTTLLDFGGQEQKYISFVENTDKSLSNEYIFAGIGHGGYAEKKLIEMGCNVKIFNSNPKITNLKNIWILYKWFKNIRPNIVHTAAAEANFHGVIASKLAGIKVIIAEEIGIPNHSFLARIIFKLIYLLTDTVICVSKSVKNHLIKISEISESKGKVIYNPASIAVTNFDINLSKDFTIVSVGRLEKVKNQQLLISAFSKIKDTNAKLILVGDGSDRDFLEDFITNLNLQERVRITGFVSNPEFYLNQAHLFVLPSLSEGFGIAVVEAMLNSVPCLCSKVGGIPEFITDSETGWLFDPNNESELISKLNSIIETPYIDIKEIGVKGKSYVKNRFTPEIYKENIENLYRELS